MPAKIWQAGDVRYERTQKVHLDSGWQVDSSNDIAPTLEAHVAALLSVLWNSLEYFRELRLHCNMQVTLMVHCKVTVPEMHLSTDRRQRLAKIGAALDIDVYC